MSNPYEPSELPAVRRSKWRWVRWLLAAPFLILGLIWSLMLIRTGDVVMEALSRHAESGRDGIVSDPAFSESLLRATVIPAMGLGVLLMGFSIVKGNRILGLLGAVWTIVGLFGIDALLRWLFN